MIKVSHFVLQWKVCFKTKQIKVDMELSLQQNFLAKQTTNYNAVIAHNKTTSLAELSHRFTLQFYLFIYQCGNVPIKYVTFK